MIDNKDIFLPLLTFEKDHFYFLQIIQRRKENLHIGADNRVIKTYYIKSIEYLEKKYGEIIALCDFFNARAYLNLNIRSQKAVALQTLKKLSDAIISENYEMVKRIYDRSCGETNNQKPKRWVIDIDHKDDHYIASLTFTINALMLPLENENKVILEVPTKNGVHLITHPFDVKQFTVYYNANFKKEYEDVPAIQKNNPTLLYCP